jgi:hypothetical protein
MREEHTDQIVDGKHHRTGLAPWRIEARHVQQFGVDRASLTRQFPLLPAQTAIQAHRRITIPGDCMVFVLRTDAAQRI